MRILPKIIVSVNENEESDIRAHLFPNCCSASEAFIGIFLRFCLVYLDHTAIKLGLVHVVNGLGGILCEREFDVAKPAMWLSRRWTGAHYVQSAVVKSRWGCLNSQLWLW